MCVNRHKGMRRKGHEHMIAIIDYDAGNIKSVEKAMQLLKGGRSVSDTAWMVGYNNPEHFNRTFRKLTGMSPAQYRKAPVEEERGD